MQPGEIENTLSSWQLASFAGYGIEIAFAVGVASKSNTFGQLSA
jgi:hypothetical protein